MSKWQLCLLAIFPVGGTAASPAQEAQLRFPISPTTVVAAMESRQLPTQSVSVKMAVPMTALSASPQLEIQAISMLNTHQMRLRMSCRNHVECLPFFATATYPEPVNTTALPAKEKALLSTSAPEHPSPSVVTPLQTGREAADNPFIIKAGSRATLDMEGSHVHIQVEVVCLEDGARGDKIRVTTHDHKQIYVARIVTPTLLKGSL